MVTTAEKYLEKLLSQEDFGSFRANFRKLVKETPSEEQMSRIERSFGKEDVFLLVVFDQRSKV